MDNCGCFRHSVRSVQLSEFDIFGKQNNRHKFGATAQKADVVAVLSSQGIPDNEESGPPHAMPTHLADSRHDIFCFDCRRLATRRRGFQAD